MRIVNYNEVIKKWLGASAPWGNFNVSLFNSQLREINFLKCNTI